MSKIRILGADYKAAYESARHIIESGMLSEEMPGCYIDSSGCIHNGNNSFEFIDGSAFHNDINESDFKMTEDGANWFSSIRNPLDADEANLLSQGTHLWEEFLSDLSRKYHDKYFLVACKRRVNDSKASDDDNRTFERYSLCAKNIMGAFYPEISDWEFSQVFDENNFDNIYGLTLRLQIGTGGEKEIPVLGTLYLKQHSKRRMMPLSADNAERIEMELEYANKNDNYNNHLNKDVDATSNSLNTLFSEFSRIMSEDKNGDILAECIHFDKTDAVNLQALLSRTQNDNKALVCKQVEILGISHVNWEKHAFVISEKSTGRDLFSIIGSIDGTILMLCIGCDDNSELILGNRVFTTDPETGESRSFIINPEEQNLGLRDEDIDLIRHNSNLSSHYLSIGAMCGMPRNDKRCKRIRCKSQLINLNTPNGNCNFCIDCPYPEVMYKSSDGQLHFTPELYFNSDSIQLDLGENLSKKACVCCGRYVTNLRNNLYCSLCATAITPTGADLKVGSENYKKYSSILPLQNRRAPRHAAKLCFEDAEILLFVIGENKYIFHKFWLDNDGHMPSPRKVTV